jgi:hypothetical protein
MGGRPTRFCLYVHFRRTSSRCQRSRVEGATMKDPQRCFGTTREQAARKACRSGGASVVRPCGRAPSPGAEGRRPRSPVRDPHSTTGPDHAAEQRVEESEQHDPAMPHRRWSGRRVRENVPFDLARCFESETNEEQGNSRFPTSPDWSIRPPIPSRVLGSVQLVCCASSVHGSKERSPRSHRRQTARSGELVPHAMNLVNEPSDDCPAARDGGPG